MMEYENVKKEPLEVLNFESAPEVAGIITKNCIETVTVLVALTIKM